MDCVQGAATHLKYDSMPSEVLEVTEEMYLLYIQLSDEQGCTPKRISLLAGDR